MHWILLTVVLFYSFVTHDSYNFKGLSASCILKANKYQICKKKLKSSKERHIFFLLNCTVKSILILPIYILYVFNMKARKIFLNI